MGRRRAGVALPPPPKVERSGVVVDDWPRVVVDPSFGATLAEWREKLPTPSAVSIAPGSTLLLQGDVSGLRIESLTLKGTLVIRLGEGARLTVRGLCEENAGWRFEPLTDGEAAPEELAIRGYKLVKEGQREVVYEAAGEYEVS